MTRKHHTPPPLSGFNMLAEQRILEAQAQGVFDDLPGARAPLQLDEDAMVPEELRAAYRILKNSGYLPPEVVALRDLREIERMLEREHDENEHSVLMSKFNVLLERAGTLRKRSFVVDSDCFQKVAEKLAVCRRRAVAPSHTG